MDFMLQPVAIFTPNIGGTVASVMTETALGLPFILRTCVLCVMVATPMQVRMTYTNFKIS